ncbi:MAG: GDSL-type esterase/lipase family protein [Bacteroidales bacterium]
MRFINSSRLIIYLFYTFLLFGTGVFAQDGGGKKKFSDHYYKRVTEFNTQKPIGNNDIVFLGNSLTEGGKWEEYFAGAAKKIKNRGGAIVNRGIIGDDAVGMYERLYQILPQNPKKIFLLVGVNDISHNISTDSVLVLVDKVVGKIIRDTKSTKLYIQSLLPANEAKSRYKTMIGKTDSIVKVNRGLEVMAKRYGVKFINLYEHFTIPGGNQLKPQLTTDGLHINSHGYAIWVNEIKKYVK